MNNLQRTVWLYKAYRYDTIINMRWLAHGYDKNSQHVHTYVCNAVACFTPRWFPQYDQQAYKTTELYPYKI